MSLEFTCGTWIALIGLGVALMSIPDHPPLWIVRASFISAAAIALIGFFLWAFDTDCSPILRMLVVGVVSSFVVIVSVEACRWRPSTESAGNPIAHLPATEQASKQVSEVPTANQPKETPVLPSPPADNRGSIVNNAPNQGNQTVNNKFDAPPPPTYREVEKFPTSKNADGTFTSALVIEVIANAPPNNMLVAIRKSADLADRTNAMMEGPLSVSPHPSGGVMKSSVDNGEYYFELLSTPHDKYLIKVKTKTATAFTNIIIQFNHKDQ